MKRVLFIYLVTHKINNERISTSWMTWIIKLWSSIDFFNSIQTFFIIVLSFSKRSKYMPTIHYTEYQVIVKLADMKSVWFRTLLILIRAIWSNLAWNSSLSFTTSWNELRSAAIKWMLGLPVSDIILLRTCAACWKSLDTLEKSIMSVLKVAQILCAAKKLS